MSDIRDAGPRLRQMNDVLEENERLRGELAWTQRERDSLRRIYQNLTDHIVELNVEAERRRSENASTRRISGEFLRRPYCGQNCADAKNDAIGPQSPAKTGTNEPRNGAPVMAWGVFSDGECYSAFDAKEDATERADRLTAADPEREFNVIPLYAECRHCFVDDTPPSHATPPQGSVPGEGSAPLSGTENEPAAWAVIGKERMAWHVIGLHDTWLEAHFRVGRMVSHGEICAVDKVEIVPLYRHPQPTLTDEERDAIRTAEGGYFAWKDDNGEGYSPEMIAVSETLRNLLERFR